MSPSLVRVEQAALGRDAQLRMVLSRLSDPSRLRSTWASSGASVQSVGGRLHAVTTLVALTRAAGRCLPHGEAEALREAAETAVDAWLDPAPALELPTGVLRFDAPVVVGVVNVTPDSFYDGGRLHPDDHPERAIRHAQRLAQEGAEILDVGGESTRPGAQPVEESEELARVLPVIEGLRGGPAVVSIDTRKPEVARQALAAGVGIVNDVSGGQDLELLETVSAGGAGYVLMHTRGTPAEMSQRTEYGDVVAEVYEFLAEGLDRCERAGIPRARIVVDPGIGFAKTAEQSIALLAAARQFRSLGRPVLIGASRKSFLGHVLEAPSADDRLEGSLAAAVMAVSEGAALVRVHDVAPTVQAVRVAAAVAGADAGWGS